MHRGESSPDSVTRIGVGRRYRFVHRDRSEVKIDLGIVYILKSGRDDRFYIGSTNNLYRRLEQHKKGLVYSTKRLLPVDLVFFQEFCDLATARNIERRLKKFRSHKLIAKIIDNGEIKLGPIAQR